MALLSSPCLQVQTRFTTRWLRSGCLGISCDWLAMDARVILRLLLCDVTELLLDTVGILGVGYRVEYNSFRWGDTC